jgi:hypothetical protein
MSSGWLKTSPASGAGRTAQPTAAALASRAVASNEVRGVMASSGREARQGEPDGL